MSKQIVKKTVLMLLLTIVSGSAIADWIAEVAPSDGMITTYKNPSFTHKSGSMVKLWELMDYKAFQKLGRSQFMSMKKRTEVDCSSGQHRILYAIYFSKNMGGGDVVVRQSSPSKWEPVRVGSSGAGSLRKLVCGKHAGR